MSKEDHILIYKDWNDQLLLNEYQELDEFDRDEKAALIELLTQRGLGDKLAEIDRFVEKSEKEFEALDYENYLVTNFGSVQDDTAYAESVKNSQGEYFAKTMLVGEKSNLFGFAVGMGIISLVIGIIFRISEMISEIYFLMIFTLGIGLIIWGIQILKNSKSNFKLKLERRKPVIEIVGKNETIRLTAPFKYTCFAQWIEVRYKGLTISRPNLYILLENEDIDGRKIMLHEDKSALKTMPPNWPNPQNNLDVLKHDLRYTQHGSTPLELEKLKRILDGLSEK